ncbi:MAG: HAMP domain-containing protein [bacterium]|nr:HAMP domain-containing protein [bacterium]
MALLTFAVFTFGVVNLLVVGRVSYRALSLEQSRRLSFAAGLLARRVEHPILHDDRVELHALLDESVALDPDLDYVVASDAQGAVLGHTFDSEIPDWVFSRELASIDREQEVLFRSEEGTLYRELAKPVLDGSLGFVRVGLDESGARAEVKSLLSVLAAMVTLFLVSGIAATIWVARRITTPLTSIIDAVEAFDLIGEPVSLNVQTGDELEVVATHVQSMTERLQRLYQAERARERDLARVERLAALGSLAAGLAHELNNPLAGIKSAAQRLPRIPSDSDRISEYASVIEDASRRMERVLKGMLDFSRPREVNLEAVSVADCVGSAIDLAQARIRKSCITFNLAPALPPVEADPDLLIQVLLNLLLNAADAMDCCDPTMECDSPKIAISAESDGDSVDLWVRDRGPGVPDEYRERIFDPFFSSKADGKGTGLGLPTSWSLIRDMGGNLTLESKVDEFGAGFLITLPTARKGQ